LTLEAMSKSSVSKFASQARGFQNVPGKPAGSGVLL
jgi:hypothetical protein